MASVSRGVLATLLCSLLVAMACSGRVRQNDGSPDGSAAASMGQSTTGTGGAGARPGGEPGGSAAASQSAGGSPGQMGDGSAAGQRQGEGGDVETSGGQGGAATLPDQPSFWWDCPLEAWGDGRCDCGCGLRDPDCADGDLATCDECDGPGSCSGAPCPGRIKAEDNRHCEPVPLGWHCPWPSYADESSCDCGCGVPDPDCGEVTSASCDTCKLPGSCASARTDGCATAIDTTDLSRCYVPEEWSCYLRYGDGVCDCGCGAIDIDCGSNSLQACEDCSDGCSSSACPGKISLTDNALCTPPPAGWRCAEHRYLDSLFCDCGCGVVDPDCATSASESCEWCNDEGSCSIQTCPGTIAPTDNATCYQPVPPAWWTCAASDYADGATCDCGCGGYDLDCPHEGPSACEDCHACAPGPCPDGVDSMSNSHCL